MRKIAVWTAFAVILTVSMCWSEDTVVRYRLSIEARVDGKPVYASGVRQVTYIPSHGELIGQSFANVEIVGEAIPIKIGDRDEIFVLLKAGETPNSGPSNIIFLAHKLPGGWLYDNRRSVKRAISTLGGVQELPLKDLPMIVKFQDKNDPSTVELVKPENISASVGPGAELVRATLEITSDPVTRSSLDQDLPWLPWYLGHLGGNVFEDHKHIEKNLTGNDFSSRMEHRK